jgi:DUF1009 family protein
MEPAPTKKNDLPPVGLIAGTGRSPILVARGVRACGRRLVVVGLRQAASEHLLAVADEFHWAGVARIGRWIRLLKSAGVAQAVMIGGVPKSSIYTPWRLVRYIPDVRTLRLYYGKVRKDRRDHALLLAVADELASEGIELVSSVEYCKEHLADEGLMTRRALPPEAQADAEFGWRIARASADLDIGQSVAVKERAIIAVEAMEGTDAMILRAGQICRTGGWTLVKVARPQQDMRFDVPTVGPQTLRNLRDARCACLVLQAGKTLIVDKPLTLELADKLGIAVIGMTAGGATD